MNAIVRHIRDIERVGGLRGTDIANVADVSKATVSRWLSGKAQPQPANELKLSEPSYITGRLDDLRRLHKRYTRHAKDHGEAGGRVIRNAY